MTSPERVAVIGCGLIGTSIAMAAVRSGDAVIGIETDARNAATAADRAGIAVGSDLGSLSDASIVVVATPIASVPERVMDALSMAPDATVTDVASVKATVLADVRRRAANGRGMPRFVPGHPMGGSERSGPASASPTIIEGATWVLSPHDALDAGRLTHVAEWVRRLGANPVIVPAARHDRLVAFVSHLPQVASTALMSLAAERESGESDALLLAAGGFRDLTRLAASNPTLWADILTANRDEVVAAIGAYVEALDELARSLGREDRSGVERAFEVGRSARLALAPRPRVRSGVAVLQVPIPDRPGALAELTRSVGAVNIEDLQIAHSVEGGRGVVHLTVAAEDVGTAESALGAAGLSAIRIA